MHEETSCASVRHALEAAGITYGLGGSYESLLSPASVLIGAREARDLALDLPELADLYRVSTALYLDSIAGASEPWIRDCVEQGLSPTQVVANRLVANAALEPRMMRVDYVDVSPASRQIAEVQWKSGGPGFIIGHDSVLRDLVPLSRGVSHYANPVDNYLRTLLDAGGGASVTLLNEARPEWLRAEQYIIERARREGLEYIPFDRDKLAECVGLTAAGLTFEIGGKTTCVNVLRGRGFTERLPDDVVLAIAQASIAGSLWVEAPLNYIYRQKWVMGLPFADRYRGLFSNKLREILIPSALVLDTGIDMTPILEHLSVEHSSRLADVRTLSELAELPESTRRSLVFKCGSGTGEMQSGGRGVFRLTGAKSNAKHLLETIAHRLLELREPWIVQPYVRRLHTVPVAHPAWPDSVEPLEAHLRFMLFGGRSGAEWASQGAVANFGRSWKVSGSKAVADRNGRLGGSAFVDVRVAGDY